MTNEQTLINIAERVTEKFSAHAPDIGEYGDYQYADTDIGFYNEDHDRSEVYEDDANIHITLNGIRLVIGYNQDTAPMSYLDRAEAYAKKLIVEVTAS